MYKHFHLNDYSTFLQFLNSTWHFFRIPHKRLQYNFLAITLRLSWKFFFFFQSRALIFNVTSSTLVLACCLPQLRTYVKNQKQCTKQICTYQNIFPLSSYLKNDARLHGVLFRGGKSYLLRFIWLFIFLMR